MGKPATLSRAERKTTKRKLEDAIPDLPGDDNAASGDIGGVGNEGEGGGRSKKRKIEGGKKSKKVVKEEETVVEKVGDGEGEGGVKVDGEEGPRKSKKERKAERRARELALKAKEGVVEAGVKGGSEAKAITSATAMVMVVGASQKGKEGKDNKKMVKNPNKEPMKGGIAKADGKPPRFIVFIGNLPFTATKASLQTHFSSVKPSQIRLLTKKEEPTKCKGCAFLEFSSWDTMKTCLKLFHHSMFDDKVSPARKINVELTAGGGGKGEERKKKIEGKNRGLNEERGRRAEVEAKAKREKGEGDGGKEETGETGVHPSRRGIVNKAARGRA